MYVFLCFKAWSKYENMKRDEDCSSFSDSSNESNSNSDDSYFSEEG